MKPIPPALAELRQSIDNIDAALVHLLAERFRTTQQVGRLKAELSMLPSDRGREAKELIRLREIAKAEDLDPDFAE